MQERFREVRDTAQAAFPGYVVNERAIRICLCRAKRRGCMSRVTAFRARSGTWRSHPRRENDDERLASTRNQTDFCLHALPTMRRGNSSARDHATDHARRKNRTSMLLPFVPSHSWIKSRYDHNRCLVPVLEQI